MATALLITRDDIVRFTQMNGNLDTDTFIQYIKISQDIEIQEMLGTDLLKKIQADIVASNLVDPYLSLLNDYIKDCLIHFAYARYLPNGAYTISNKGIYKHNSENSDTVSKEEIDYLEGKAMQTAMHYKERFVQYMNFHQSDFPEFTSNKDGDVFPSDDINFTGWVM